MRRRMRIRCPCLGDHKLYFVAKESGMNSELFTRWIKTVVYGGIARLAKNESNRWRHDGSRSDFERLIAKIVAEQATMLANMGDDELEAIRKLFECE